MQNFLFIIFMHLLPLILFLIPLLLFFDITLKTHKNKTLPEEPKPSIDDLEQKLAILISKNKAQDQSLNLTKELENTPSNTIMQYITKDNPNSKKHHLFQLIFTYIKNNAEDDKIIRIMRHYFKTSSTAHLYAMLKSYKVFLHIIKNDKQNKTLLKDLFNNNTKTTLIYLEEKLHQKLNELPTLPSSMQPIIINQAVIYGIIFASFAKFYDKTITLKILKLTKELSPNLFKYWHTPPKPSKFPNPSDQKYCINYYTSKKIKKTLDYKNKSTNNTPQ
ncbi:MAG: hypothetical protein E7005_07795 [Alphaproteobacteria bacterium]|nr:hypothetical protein [Alphaproteobacteria bacterium]